jgi:putative transposase
MPNPTPIERFERAGPHRAVDPDRLREAFRWSVTRKVTRIATVPLEGNAYGVDPALVGRRVELRYDPRTSPASTSTSTAGPPAWPPRS